jgi:ketosteroid isomerase-like protein
MITVQKDAADPQKVQELHALVTKFDDAKNNNDSAAVAALFSEEAILVSIRSGSACRKSRATRNRFDGCNRPKSEIGQPSAKMDLPMPWRYGIYLK